jgi:hypothetical protein
MVDSTTGEIIEGLWRFEALHPEWTEGEGGDEEGWEQQVAWWAVATLMDSCICPTTQGGSVLGLGNSKLLREGAETQGVVIDVKRQMVTGGNFGDTYHITVRVRFDDGSVAETKQKLSASKAGKHFAAAVVPVRYDVADHSKLAVDVPALEALRATTLAEREAVRKERIAQAEAEVGRDTCRSD